MPLTQCVTQLIDLVVDLANFLRKFFKQIIEPVNALIIGINSFLQFRYFPVLLGRARARLGLIDNRVWRGWPVELIKCIF